MRAPAPRNFFVVLLEDLRFHFMPMPSTASTLPSCVFHSQVKPTKKLLSSVFILILTSQPRHPAQNAKEQQEEQAAQG
jgi:hypothetical protein